MQKKRSVGLILSYANTFLSMITGLFLSSFLIRRLGNTDYGVYQTMSSFANYLVLLEFRTGTVISRNLVSAKTRRESQLQIEKNISTIWTITSALSAVILAVSVIFYMLIPLIYSKSFTDEQITLGKQIFIYIVVFLVVSFFSQTLNGIALAYEHYTFASAMSIVKMAVRTTLLIILVLATNQVIVISMVDAAIGLFIAIYTYFYCRKHFHVRINFRHFDRVILRASLPMCLAIFLQAIVNQSNNIVGKFVLGVMAGPEEVALYSVALYVFSIFSSLSTIPISMYSPQVTRSVISGLERLDLTKSLVQPCRLMVLISGSVLFGFIACGKQFINIVYGQEYALTWIMAIMLIGPSFLNMSNGVVINVLDAKNKRHIRSYLLMITTALNVIMTVFGIKQFGIIAASAATGLATFAQVVMLNCYYQKAIHIEVMYLFTNVFKGILPFQIIGAIVGYFVGSIIPNEYLSFLVSGIIYIVIAFGSFLLFGKSEAEAHMITGFIKKLKNK